MRTYGLRTNCAAIILACAIALSIAPFMLAADVTGSISGVVKDPSGAVAPGIDVTVINTGTNASFHATSDTLGVYVLRNLPVGVYDLSTQASGFKKFISKGIRVQVNETVRVDIALALGDISEVVDVSGAVETVDTTTPTLRAVVDQKRIEELPLNGRNPTQLMQLIAGVIPDPINANVTSDTTYPGVTPVSVNGGRANATNYILDGGQNNDHYSNAPNPMPNPDALQEFSVQTNNFSAEFGRNMGGIVNAVTRSGTNSLHGSGFWYLRDKSLNAANFFAPINEDGTKQDDGLKRHQFGATVGGPVYIPGLYNGRDKTFFFFSFQRTTLRQAPSRVEQIVPTAAQRSGDFSALGQPLNDPFNGGTYANNQIPSSQLSPISLAMLETIPVPAAGSDTISYAIPNKFDDNQYLVRIDHQLTKNNKLTGRYWDSQAQQPAFLDPKNFLTATPGHNWRNQSVVATDTHVIRPNIINTALFDYNRTNNLNAPIPPPQNYNQLGSNVYSPPIAQWYVEVGGYFTIDTNDTNTFLREEIQIADTVRWVVGRHQISFGGEYGHGVGDIDNNYRANGIFSFSGAAPFTGDSLADFMVGKFENYEQGIGEYKNTRFNSMAMFVQDSFRATQRLTLDLGLRWEPFFPYTDLNGKLSAWRPGQQSTRYVNAPTGVLYPGDPGLPDGGYDRAWRNFGPRVGFALDVFGDGKTSLRGGYGIFYDRPNTISTNSAANQGPFGTLVDTSGNNINSIADPYAGTTNPFPAPVNPPSDTQFVLPHLAFVYVPGMRNGYLQAWNLALEHQVMKDLVVRAAYAASKGTHLVDLREGNAAIYSPGATTATTNERRPLYPNFARVTFVEPASWSNYNSLQLSVERRFAKGVSFLGNYTFSRSLDQGSYAKQTGQTVTNPFNIGQDKGLSDFHRAHVFTASGLWALPGPKQSALARTVLGGWSLNGILSLRSGFPFSVYSGVDNARSGVGNDRADQIGNPFFSGNRSRGEQVEAWLNPAAFDENALGTFGTSGRNAFIGPGFVSMDFGLAKDIPIHEQLKAQFRFEAFNVFNHPNLVGPSYGFDNDHSSGNFMKITSADDPRILQFALRLVF